MYTYSCTNMHIPPQRDFPKPQDPMVMFNDSGIKLKEVRDFAHKAHTGSALDMNGISYKLYKNCSCSQETHFSSSAGLEEGYCTTGMLSGLWYLDTKRNAVERYHEFSPNIPPKFKGKYRLK